MVTIKNVEELAEFLIDFWVDITNNGYNGKLPWIKERGEINDTANMLMFVQARENEGYKYFTPEEIKLAKTRCIEHLKNELLSNDWGFSIDNLSIGMGCFFSTTFGEDTLYKRDEKSGHLALHWKSKLFSVELILKYFPPKERYVNNRIYKDATTENKEKMLKDYPSRPILSIKERDSSKWETIAYVDL